MFNFSDLTPCGCWENVGKEKKLKKIKIEYYILHFVASKNLEAHEMRLAIFWHSYLIIFIGIVAFKLWNSCLIWEWMFEINPLRIAMAGNYVKDVI